jgi:hypothetical protein
MVWGSIQEKLKNAFTVKISFPAGTIWVPAHALTTDEWLTSIAETDEELRELNIPRIQFLQNRWPIVTLLELEWSDEFSNRRVIVAMFVGPRAYILFSDWNDYQVIAAIEPKDRPSLYRAVIGNVLENRLFVPKRPTRIRNRCPDLVPDLVPLPHREIGSTVPMDPHSKSRIGWNGFISDILVGWIGKWLNMPELGFWHQDLPESISRQEKGEILMRYRYKPTYGDKQREGQRREKEQQLREHNPGQVKTPVPENSNIVEEGAKKRDKGAA